MSNQKIILVTGANRGIGLAIIEALGSNQATKDSVLLLGCRDLTNGEDAVKGLRELGVESPNIIPVVIDVTSDASIEHAVQLVERQFGHLDVLVNNAGFAAIPSTTDTSDWRETYSKVLDVNVTSVAVATQMFLPLLRKSLEHGQVINVSSGRASIALSAGGSLPPSVSIPYSISKTTLNMLTVELSRDPANKGVDFQIVSPGHCKTAFNGYRGTRDPLEGANVVVELVKARQGKYKNLGFWETKGSSLELVEIPW